MRTRSDFDKALADAKTPEDKYQVLLMMRDWMLDTGDANLPAVELSLAWANYWNSIPSVKASFDHVNLNACLHWLDTSTGLFPSATGMVAGPRPVFSREESARFLRDPVGSGVAATTVAMRPTFIRQEIHAGPVAAERIRQAINSGQSPGRVGDVPLAGVFGIRIVESERLAPDSAYMIDASGAPIRIDLGSGRDGQDVHGPRDGDVP